MVISVGDTGSLRLGKGWGGTDRRYHSPHRQSSTALSFFPQASILDLLECCLQGIYIKGREVRLTNTGENNPQDVSYAVFPFQYRR